ncbi:ketoacyl-synt-domain-containing protein [Xylariaceae sp. AK1471]|nr:ketoacyl-synt-domain-containing protein [Xylariaceae sp. AK1471]
MEPIAIIGIGCRMPGGVRSPRDLWELMMSKGIASSAKVPKSRFDIDAYLHPNNERPGSFNVSGGYFLDHDPREFDPAMFKISPVEALWMDPQQRRLLEVVYEAFESSGTKLEDVSGKKMGCFVGSFTVDYQMMVGKETDFKHAYAATGIDTGILANRLSYVFNLNGPSITLNTACSSSLYALDLACKMICSGQCDSAIVGGVNLMLTVDQQMNTAKLGVLSATNQSRPFDQEADGYGRAEGVGALYLKPLSAAIRDGDPIRSVIRGTATSSNGRCKDGMIHPSVKGQAEVIALAYQLSGLRCEDTSYVECHGTGTRVGDPVEVEAIHAAMGASRTRTDPLLIGSIKANVGHSEAASSMATLIKATLALEHGTIPPTAGLTKLSSSIPWSSYNIRVVTTPIPFPSSPSPRRIGVSAYGYGGTNAHAILESAETAVARYLCHKSTRLSKESANDLTDRPNHSEGGNADRAHLLLFSAHDVPTLQNNLADLSEHCQDINLLDLAHTLGLRRTKLAQRTFAISRKGNVASAIRGAALEIVSNARETTKAAFVFTGQGAQWSGMGAALLGTFPSVMQTIRSLDHHLSRLTEPPSWKLETMMSSSEHSDLVNEPEYSQPLCTAIQIALVDLLTHWGVMPVATIGHSSGEIAAAYAAGLISAQSTITAAYFRGKVAASHKTDGAMIATGLGAEQVTPYLEDVSSLGRVVIACYNSPNSTTLSGDREAIEKLKEILDEAKVFSRLLKTGRKAYHSHHMLEASIQYAAHLKKEATAAEAKNKGVTMFSTVTAKPISNNTDQGLSDAYWADNLNSPVLFEHGVRSMLRDMPDIGVLIEIGPHSTLSSPLRQICQSVDRTSMVYLPTLKRKAHDTEQILRLAGNLWAIDVPIDVRAVTGVDKVCKDGSIRTQTGMLLVDLPTYHWTYAKSNLAEPPISKEHRMMKTPRHDILGRRVVGMSPLGAIWRNVLRQRDLPWIVHHRVGGDVIVPAAGYLAIAIEAIMQVNEESQEVLEVQSYTIRDMVISSATVIPDDDKGTETMFYIWPTSSELETIKNARIQLYHFKMSSCSYGTWKETCRGIIGLNVKGATGSRRAQDFPDMRYHSKHIDWLDKLRTVGVDLGPAFQQIRDVYTDSEASSASAMIKMTQSCGLMENESRYVIHPTTLDSCLQPALAAMHRGRLRDLRCGLIPTHFGEVTVYPGSAEQLTNYCTLQLWSPMSKPGNRATTSNIQVFTHDGVVIVDIVNSRALLYRAAIPRQMQGNLQQNLYVKLDWKIDADYLGWANDSGAFLENPVTSVVDIQLHKDASSCILCLDYTLIPSILSARRDVRMKVLAPPSREIKLAILTGYAGGESIDFIDDITQAATDPEAQNGEYDLVIASATHGVESIPLEHIRRIISHNGRLLLLASNSRLEEWDPALKSAGFRGTSHVLPGSAIVTTAEGLRSAKNGSSSLNKKIVLVYGDVPAPICSVITEHLKEDGWDVRLQAISSTESILDEQVVLLIDAEEPFLAHITQGQLDGLVKLTENTSAIIWVTCGGLLHGDKPAYGMVAGVCRTLRKEKNSLDLVSVDFDTGVTPEDRVAGLLVDIANRQRTKGRTGETEYYVKSGVVYVGRLVSCRDLHQKYVVDSGEYETLGQNESPSVKGVIKNGTVVFCRDGRRLEEPLGAEDVEVQVATMGLTESDGADDTTFLNHEMTGTVVRVGSEVKGIAVGTKVMGFACDSLATFQRTSADLVQVIPQESSLKDAATLPSAFATAIYGLEELARIQEGDRVVIIDGMGAVGLAALQLCHIHKASAIVITSSTRTASLVREEGQLLPLSSSILSHGCDLLSELETATEAQGVDILFCSLTADNEASFIECGRALAPFARIVTFGKSNTYRPLLSSLSTANTRGLSFFHFDLPDLLVRRRRAVASVLERCAHLYRDRHIQPLVTTKIGGPTEINELLWSTPSEMGQGKHLIAYEPTTTFKVLPSPTLLKFRDDVIYLLVGCLTGVGRHVALWMATRGVRHLAFISRSGTENKPAAQTVEQLKAKGVQVLVLCADIANRGALTRAITGINSAIPIGGVVNAAGILHDATFNNMTLDAWNSVVQTKVNGCLNLHEVLKNETLDFFVMTSSISSILGSSGQANYAAGNSYLDSLARHRHSLGLPAVSLILPAIFGVGFLAENAELEHLIQIKGIYGIREEEMLEAFEVAMRPQASLPPNTDHIIVGMQPRRFAPALKAVGLDISQREDPRLNWMALAMEEHIGHSAAGNVRSSEGILVTLQKAASQEQAVSAVVAHITQTLAQLLMIEEESIQSKNRSVASYGLDSMIGAEFRNRIFREFNIDLPFQQLLAGSLTISELARLLCETHLSRLKA